MQFLADHRRSRRSLATIRAALSAASGHMRGLVSALQNRRRAASLLTLNDHMLQDIGITRLDVASALSSPLVCDPTTELAAFAAERRAAARAQARERLARSTRRI